MLGPRDLQVVTHFLHQQSQPSSSLHHTIIPTPSPPAFGVGVSIFPILAATPCVVPPPPPSTGTETCDNLNHSSYWGVKKCGDNPSERQLKDNAAAGDSGDSLRVCTDCGNRAKKGCGYRRCRTCCKNRGYDCVTHVKSTWLPASRRRERKVVVCDGGVGGSSFGAKRSRTVGVSSSSHNATTVSHASASNTDTTPRSFDTSSFHQDASFKESLPGRVRAPAVFRCTRVTTISDGEAEFAYQATVNISGHVFKGFLYDQGVDEKNELPCISKLHCQGSTNGKNRDSSYSPVVNPSDAYATSGRGKLLGGAA